MQRIGQTLSGYACQMNPCLKFNVNVVRKGKANASARYNNNGYCNCMDCCMDERERLKKKMAELDD